ncbi:hypothetical protein U1Q18_045990, partial [Sarracenia purpurea var. burkii]
PRHITPAEIGGKGFVRVPDTLIKNMPREWRYLPAASLWSSHPCSSPHPLFPSDESNVGSEMNLNPPVALFV